MPMYVSQKLVHLIENHADELTQRYLQDVKKLTSMPTYRNWNEKEVYQRAFAVYSQLGKWISYETTKEEIRDYWTRLGKQRCQEGFALSEVIQAVHLVRKNPFIFTFQGSDNSCSYFRLNGYLFILSHTPLSL